MNEELTLASIRLKPIVKFYYAVFLISLSIGMKGQQLDISSISETPTGIFTNEGGGVGIEVTSNGTAISAHSTNGAGIDARGSTAGFFIGDVEIYHQTGTSKHLKGLRLINNVSPFNWWNFHVDEGGGHLFLYSKEKLDVSVGNFSDNSGTYFATSDRRTKKHISPLRNTLDFVKLLKPKTYLFNEQSEEEAKFIGLIAQEVQLYFPELVSHDVKTDLYSMDYASLSVVAVKAIQEQQQIIENQQKVIDQLVSRVTHLENIK